MSFELFSPAFANRSEIPPKYTCQGENVSPPLKWSQPPAGVKSYALIVEDPDAPDPEAPKTVWDHWVLYNIPAQRRELEEDYGDLPKGSLQGLNSWDKIGYGGPCPPIGQHRYIFKLYALDTFLENLGKPGKKKLLKSMEGHILGEAKLTGLYHKHKS